MSVDFIDSNVFIDLLDTRDPRKHDIAKQLIASAIGSNDACISFQVVQESLRVITSKLPVPASPDIAQAFLQHSLQPLWTVMPSAALYASAMRLKERWQLALYDALIVAAALEGGSKRLLTEDLQHGQRIEGLRIVNPFK